MFESRVNPPPRRDLPQELLAALVAIFAVVMVFGVVAKQDAGQAVSPWAWPIAGLLLAASAAIFEWHLLWRAWRPPLRLDPGALPAPFDWDAVGRRMREYYDTEDAATANPAEKDGIYLAIHDAVTMEYVDVVRELLTGYEGSVSWYPLEPEFGGSTGPGGRASLVPRTSGGSIPRWCCPARTAVTGFSWSTASTPKPTCGPTGRGARASCTAA